MLCQSVHGSKYPNRTAWRGTTPEFVVLPTQTVTLVRMLSINLFHPGSLIYSTIYFFKGRKVIIIVHAIIIIINAQTQLDHSMNSSSELCWFIRVETRC